MADSTFFNNTEIEHFASIAGTPYRIADPVAVANGNQLKPLPIKMNDWIRRSIPEGYTALYDNSWQWSGTFKSYLWIRVYKDSPINRPQPKVYFVFGINDSEELYMELNCQRSNHTMGSNVPLEIEKIKSFDSYLEASDYSQRFIPAAELQFYDWDRLIRETKEFIKLYADIYGELLNILNPETSIGVSSGGLNLVSKPNSIRSKISVNPSFNGVEIDYEAVSRTSKFLGNSGEEIVIKHEKNKLSELNHIDLIDQVVKVKDGEGYDILSFDEQRNPVFIEVKTTTGPESEPFYISHNELAFAEKNKQNYYIYRVFDFRSAPSMGGSFYIWTWEDLSKATRTALQFEISKN